MFNKTERNLIWELTLSDFKLKYNRSVLGFFWSFLKPLLMLGVLYLVFHTLLNFGTPNYEFFLLLGIVLWNFFTESTSNSMQNFVDKKSLIKNVYFPRTILVVSSCLNAFMSLLLNIGVFLVILFFAGLFVSWPIIILPLLLIEVYILSLGFSFALSSLHVKYRDVLNIWEVLLLVGFWISPIIYPVSFVPQQYLSYYMLNPMARIINDARNVVIFHQELPSFLHMGITLFVCLAVLAIGYLIFKRKSPKFAEEI